MRWNTEGPRRSAKLRSASVLERAQAAIRQMQADEASINFRTVDVSTAWLYKTKLQRDRIMRLRAVPITPAANDTRRSRMTSQERVIATLRFRIKLLEEKNRELSEQLERTYGKLAYASKYHIRTSCIDGRGQTSTKQKEREMEVMTIRKMSKRGLH